MPYRFWGLLDSCLAAQDCTLLVPPNPLSAAGLATPYQLTATNSKNGPCHESEPGQRAFVEAAILDLTTGDISIYHPLVTDKGVTPMIPPVVPVLPKNAVVALWFGFNGNKLTLKAGGDGDSQGDELKTCVNGVKKSVFGQFAYCNAVAWFEAANKFSAAQLNIPEPGEDENGNTCPTVVDWVVVDQDPSDNLLTTYLLRLSDKRTAQDTPDNRKELGIQDKDYEVLTNPSDERLSVAINNALKGECTSTTPTAPDLADPPDPADPADPGSMVPALALLQLQAAMFQAPPPAPPPGLVPAGDPMVLVNGVENLAKLNAYRVGVNEPTVSSLDKASTLSYCSNLFQYAPVSYTDDYSLLHDADSPDEAVANNLLGFLALRFENTDLLLNCSGLLNKDIPIKAVDDDDDDKADGANITLPTPPAL